MINDEINILLRKADELRSLFVLGQKVIPFLEEIFVFVSEIQPLLDEINKSITENLRRMPSASKQLSKVTEATELATNEIMDLVDGIVFNSETINSNLNRIQKMSELEFNKPVQILELIYNAIENGTDLRGLQPELGNVIESLKSNLYFDKTEIFYNTREILKTIQTDSSSIMISLQVQDITSQQIAAVNKLLETIQNKLESILKHFRDSDLSEMVILEAEAAKNDINVSTLHREIAFDPNAVDAIANKGFRQTEVDEYVRQAKENIESESNTEASQDDIDKMFQSLNDKSLSPNHLNTDVKELYSVPNLKEVSSVEDNNIPLNNDDDFDSVSQDDIDKMFN